VANLAHVVNTQANGTSQAGGSDSDSSTFSFSVTTPTLVTQMVLSEF